MQVNLGLIATLATFWQPTLNPVALGPSTWEIQQKCHRFNRIPAVHCQNLQCTQWLLFLQLYTIHLCKTLVSQAIEAVTKSAMLTKKRILQSKASQFFVFIFTFILFLREKCCSSVKKHFDELLNTSNNSTIDTFVICHTMALISVYFYSNRLRNIM